MIPRLEIRFSLRQQVLFCFGKRYRPVEGEFLLNHARSGIWVALKAMDLPEGCPVGVMALNCHTVFNAVAQAGCTPVFIDVTDALTLDREDLRRKRAGLGALIVTHLFGFVSDIDSIREEFPDLPIIEDCAHGMGIPAFSGDVTVFSIGQGKLPSLGDGGILYVNNDRYLSEVISKVDALPGYSFAGNVRLFCTMLIKSILYRPWVYPWLTHPMKRRRSPGSGREVITPRQMSGGIRALYQAAGPTLPTLVEQRRQKALQAEIGLKEIPGVSGVLDGSINGFMSVIRCDDRNYVREVLHQQGVEAEMHFANCLHWAQSFGYTGGQCPNTKIILDHYLMVPTYRIR